MIEQSIVEHLLADTAITAIIGTRLRPDPMEQDITLPAIAYRKVSGSRGYDLSGPDGTGQARMQFDCWASGFEAAKLLAEAVIDSMNEFDADVNISADLDSYEPVPGAQRIVVDAEILYVI